MQAGMYECRDCKHKEAHSGIPDDCRHVRCFRCGGVCDPIINSRELIAANRIPLSKWKDRVKVKNSPAGRTKRN